MAKIDKFLSKASERLLHGEQMLAAVEGEYPGKYPSASAGGQYLLAYAVLIATNIRLIVVVDGFYAHNVYVTDYDHVRSIELTLDTKGHLITFKHRSGDREFSSGDDWAKFRHIKDVIAAQNIVAVVSRKLDKRASKPRKAKSQSVPKKLRELADLHAAGILTDAEYASKKADLLQQM